jgi:hypothetical protein
MTLGQGGAPDEKAWFFDLSSILQTRQGILGRGWVAKQSVELLGMELVLENDPGEAVSDVTTDFTHGLDQALRCPGHEPPARRFLGWLGVQDGLAKHGVGSDSGVRISPVSRGDVQG